MPSCPGCGSEKVIKNGSIHNGKPKFSCKECRRQFVENPSNKIIPQETWNLVDKLLLEKISSAGISRVTGISEVWIQNYINKKYEHAPKRTEAVFKKAVWFCNVMKYGLLSDRKREKSGYGLRLTDVREKLPEHMQEAGTRKAHSAFGIHFRNHARKTLCFILISGQHIKKFSLKADIFPSERTAERQVISNGSILLCGSEFHVLEEKRFHFLKIWRIILGHFGILFIITMKI